MERLEQAGLNRAWISAEAALLLEWRIEGRVRASEDHQSERWRVWATGPNGERTEARG